MADIEYLKSLRAVRERAQIVFAAAQTNQLSHFTYHPEHMPKTAEYVVGIIKVWSSGGYVAV